MSRGPWVHKLMCTSKANTAQGLHEAAHLRSSSHKHAKPFSRLFPLPETLSFIFSTGLTPPVFQHLAQGPLFWNLFPDSIQARSAPSHCSLLTSSVLTMFLVIIFYLFGQTWFSGFPEAFPRKHQSGEVPLSCQRLRSEVSSFHWHLDRLFGVWRLGDPHYCPGATAWPSWSLSPK